MVVSSGSLIDVVVSYADGALVVLPTEVFLSSKPILCTVVSFVGGEVLVSIVISAIEINNKVFWGKIICYLQRNITPNKLYTRYHFHILEHL